MHCVATRPYSTQSVANRSINALHNDRVASEMLGKVCKGGWLFSTNKVWGGPLSTTGRESIPMDQFKICSARSCRTPNAVINVSQLQRNAISDTWVMLNVVHSFSPWIFRSVGTSRMGILLNNACLSSGSNSVCALGLCFLLLIIRAVNLESPMPQDKVMPPVTLRTCDLNSWATRAEAIPKYEEVGPCTLRGGYGTGAAGRRVEEGDVAYRDNVSKYVGHEGG